ncbi:MAG: sulfotransferase domain-containing protein [Gallionella sp.]
MILYKSLITALRFAVSGRKVDFVIAGVQKAGTSALDAYLRAHPEICMAKQKEVHFFDRTRFFWLIPNYFAYHAHFSAENTHQLFGEATPIYAYWDVSIQRIWKYNPQMKIIVVLRNPIERAYSHWNMERQRGYETLPFLEAIEKEEQRCKGVLPSQHRVYSYLDRGWYSVQIRRIWRFFPREQIMFIKYETLLSSPNEVLEGVWRFLGVSPIIVEKKIVHARNYESKISEDEFQLLQDRYKHEIRQIESMLGWDCSDWLSALV